MSQITKINVCYRETTQTLPEKPTFTLQFKQYSVVVKTESQSQTFN